MEQQKEGFKPKIYPELIALSKELADKVCIEINEKAPKIDSEMPYKQQYVLENMISILEDRV